MDSRFKFRFYDTQNKIMIDEHSDYEKILDLYGTDEWWWCVEYRLTTVFDIFDNRDFKIMQCTGLKDKNGKLIYEGDIVRESFGETGTYKVEFFPYTAEWQWVNLNDEEANWEMFSIQFEGMSENQGVSTDLEVIGNIYENADLLKGYENEKKNRAYN